jgi:predicted nucleic acid-binding protein
MLILVDTNILPRMADSSHPLAAVAAAAVDRLHSAGHDLVLVPQVLYEFWAVSTRSVEANGLGKRPEYAEDFMERFCRLFRLLRDERSIYERWLQQVTRHRIVGVRSFDARLAAAMARHQVQHILTFNGGDFRRFDGATVVDPAVVPV